MLQVKIHQYHNAKDHRLASFRLAVSTSPTPVGLSLPESLAAVLATQQDKRSDAQKTLARDYLAKSDNKYRQLQDALAAAKRPLAVDAGVLQREAVVKELEQEIPDDPVLVQLRQDVQASTQQHSHRRLTAVQDLAWALINSPEFLFNH